MNYTRISADCHIDMPWIPPDLFTGNARAAIRDRMPFVTDGPDGPMWTSKNGASFGLVGGVGPSGTKYAKGEHYRADAMAATGLFYIAILFVLVGELLGRLILFRTSLPL